MGSGVLGLGFGQGWVYLGKRVLARRTAGQALGSGILGPNGGRLAMDDRILGTGG